MFDSFDLKKLILVALILSLPLLSLNLERRDTGDTKWYNRAFEFVVHPMQEFMTNFSSGVTDTTSRYLNLMNIKDENAKLRAEVLELKEEILKRQEVQLENERLRKQLEFQSQSPSPQISAQVTGIDLLFNSDYHSITINKGSNHGLKPKLGVVTREGVVGYILRVFPDYSIVLLNTDRNAVVDVMVQRSRARGLSEGSGANACEIKYLQRTDDVQVGDLVITSGNDEMFPKGIPAGIVSRVLKKSFGVSQSVEMSPLVDISRVEEVFVILKSVTPPEESPKKEGT